MLISSDSVYYCIGVGMWSAVSGHAPGVRPDDTLLSVHSFVSLLSLKQMPSMSLEIDTHDLASTLPRGEAVVGNVERVPGRIEDHGRREGQACGNGGERAIGVDAHDLARTDSLRTREARHRNAFQGIQAALPIKGDA
jgi:hypothetical protein